MEGNMTTGPPLDADIFQFLLMHGGMRGTVEPKFVKRVFNLSNYSRMYKLQGTYGTFTTVSHELKPR